MLLAILWQGVCVCVYAQDDKPTSVPMQKVTPERPQGVAREGTIVLQGLIKDSQGEALPGAAVRVRESKAGATADENGVFTLSVPKGKSVTIDVSFVGMKTLTKTYDGNRNHTNLVFTLQDNTQLNDVVVTGLFDYKSSTFTGSASSYTQDDLKMISGTSVLKAVQASRAMMLGA